MNRISLDDFKKLISSIIQLGDVARTMFELHPIPPFDELEKELNISPDIELSEFCDKMLNNDSFLNRIQVFKKDRTEWGYYRYKILMKGKTGEMIYAFDLNQAAGRVSTA